MRKECYSCHNKTVSKLSQKFDLDIKTADKFASQVDRFIQSNLSYSNPLIATHIHRIAKKYIDTDDIYANEKNSANKLLLDNYEYWKQIITESKNPFQQAAKLAVIGNIIDYGAHSVPDDIEAFIEAKLKEDFYTDDSNKLQEAVKNAKSILYLGDNAGEIVMDKLFIETIQHPNITFAVRGSSILNDVTLKDAQKVGIDKLCKIIDNGYDAPSTLLEHCSKKFNTAFEEADLIISKGQGNYEGLMDNKSPKIVFMLMCKCDIIADMIGVKKGAMIIKQQQQ